MVGEDLQPSERSSESHQPGVIRRHQVSSGVIRCVIKHTCSSGIHTQCMYDLGGGGEDARGMERWR